MRLPTLFTLLFALAVPAFGQGVPAEPAISFPPDTLIQPLQVWDQFRAMGRPKADHPTNAACCKICSKGKACGDSCISRSYQCHKGPGCACDG